MLTRPLVFVLSALIVCSVAAAQPSPLVVKRSDGQIDPLASDLRAKSLSFAKEAGLALSTRLRVGFDGRGVWTSFECEDTRLAASVTDPAAALDGEDQVRVTLTSPDAKTVHVILSGLGQLRAARLSGSDSTALSADEAISLESAAIVLGEGAMFVPGKPHQDKLEAWIGSVFLPWSLFGADGPSAGWTASFERSDYDSGSEALWRSGAEPVPLSFE